MNYGRRKIQLTSPPSRECAKQTFHYNKSHCTQGARCYSNRFTIERRGQCSERGLLVQPRNWQYILVPISDRVGKRGREREEKPRLGVTMIPRGGCWSWILIVWDVERSFLEVTRRRIGRWLDWFVGYVLWVQRVPKTSWWFKRRSLVRKVDLIFYYRSNKWLV